MASTQAGVILRHIRGLAADRAGEVPDSDLLARYTEAHEEAAFAALVRRHGPLVLGVCRRVLGNVADAEDAFQAAFLALARKAESIRKRESVGCWLYRVAFYAAMRARGQAATRKKAERQVNPHSSTDPLAELTGRELLTVLDEELQRLPEHHRTPLVLCYLQGLTCDEAARQAGWALRTFKRRLEQARTRLRARLLRRGLALPGTLLAAGLSQTAEAAVPTSLAGATVRAAVQGTGEASPAVLAAGVTGGAGLARLKVISAALLLGGLISFGAVALAQQAAPVEVPQGGTQVQQQKPSTIPPLAQKKLSKPAQKGVHVSGRVLGPDGKPLAGAGVALVGRWHPSEEKPNHEYEVLAQGKTDAEGRFRLARADIVPTKFYHFHALAGAKGHGLGWAKLPRGGEQEKVELRLEPERVIRGRLLDLQGLPAGGVKGRPVYLAWKELPSLKGDPKQLARMEMMRAEFAARMARRGGVVPFRRDGGFEFDLPKVPVGLALWPRGFTTDAQGRFEVRGLSAGQELHLLIEDDRFATQELQADTGGAKPSAEVSLSLAPAQRIEGRVVYADTGKPAAGVHVNVQSFRGNTGKDAPAVTDAEGKFALNPYPGSSFNVQAWAPADQPYLSVQKRVAWPRGAARQTVDFSLPRGVEIRGKVREAPSGKPHEGARVYFAPRRDNEAARANALLIGSNWPARTAADGSFRLVVPPGPGHLLADAGDPNFIARATSVEELQTGKPGGQRRFHHEVLPLNLELKDGPRELEIKLRRGVTLRGKVLGLDDKPVSRGLLICSRELLTTDPNEVRFVGADGEVPHGLMVVDGRFELPGCDPDKTYRVYLLDAMFRSGIMAARRVDVPPSRLLGGMMGDVEARSGAVVDLSAAKAKGRELTIKLLPCGTAQVRLLDAEGKPSSAIPWVELDVVPGRGKVAGERATLGLPGPTRGKTPLSPNAEGRVSIRGLIPGATYRLKAYDFRAQTAVPLGDAFTVEAGKTRELPDAVAP